MSPTQLKDLLYDYAHENPDFMEEEFGLFYCEHCDEFVTPTTKTISGSVGHIDNWQEDETFQLCPDCSGEVGE